MEIPVQDDFAMDLLGLVNVKPEPALLATKNGLAGSKKTDV